jgi:hypothetical protein
MEQCVGGENSPP